MSSKKNKKLLIVGWDAADWKVINPLMDRGQMPALEKLVNRGVMGNLATLDPPLSPMLWTSIATGKTADKHGILNFAEPHPEKLEVRPISSISRKTKAFWNMLHQSGLKSNIIGWWPSNPAEPINGAMVSNLFPKIGPSGNEDWPLYAGSVHPPELNELMTDLRVHPNDLSMSHLMPFVPNAHELYEHPDKYVKTLSMILAEAATNHNAATWLMENTEWDVTAVYYDAIDATCHGFMKYYPPQMPGIPDDYFNNYKEVVPAMYKFHDMMLERLLELAGEDTTVLLLSDHGFHSDHLRPKRLPTEPDAPAMEHRNFGVFCLSGPGIRKDEIVYGASLLDITPTILTILDLPVGMDMDGKPLVSVFEKEVRPKVIESWDKVEGEAGMHREEIVEDPIAAQEALKQLVELGYIEAPGPDMQKNIDRVIGQTQFNLARVYLNRQKYDLALPILEKLYRENPDVPRYGFRYASCLHHLKKMEECRRVIDSLKDTDSRNMPQLDFMEGTLLLAENQPRKALECFSRAEKSASHLPNLHVQIGSVYNKLYRWENAIAAFEKALKLDPESPHALMGKGLACLRLQRYEDAIDSLLDAVGLLYNMPHAHYFLGEALMATGDHERAAEAFKVCTHMEPGFRRAYAWLVKIYEEHIPNPQLADTYKKFMEKNIQGSITVVSGLPRSGTSMMMQMLQAGGLDILTDNARKEDVNNPKGYLEYEKVKSLATDNSWLGEANGKVVKVVTQLLNFLPPRYKYKVIFMQRDMNEVLRSQQVMLGKPADQANLAIADVFKKQLEKCQAWLRSQPHIEVLYVDYHDVIGKPAETAENVAAFLGGEMDLEAMGTVVDPTLYRNRIVTT